MTTDDAIHYVRRLLAILDKHKGYTTPEQQATMRGARAFLAEQVAAVITVSAPPEQCDPPAAEPEPEASALEPALTAAWCLCGCAARGRHRADCPGREQHELAPAADPAMEIGDGAKSAIVHSDPKPEKVVLTARPSAPFEVPASAATKRNRFAELEAAAAARRAGSVRR